MVWGDKNKDEDWYKKMDSNQKTNSNKKTDSNKSKIEQNKIKEIFGAGFVNLHD